MRLLFVTSDTPQASFIERLVSKAISGFDSGGVSHGGVMTDLDPGQVYDSTWTHGGVKRWPRQEWLAMHGRQLVHEFDVRVPDERAGADFLTAQLGKPYDTSAIWGMTILRDWQDDDRWYCFELALAACIKAGIPWLGPRGEIGGRLAVAVAHAWSLRNGK